ncbi:hypothetical protein RclHR1_00850017 [Rhizophagus clarus]|uniref:Uncharacterized protein n=1 Tax=Rhizophagus clarus TaxID=94130 RepID=A0A2Z6S162_9GLOM|nr:hypothetical protein RclHR1_00850017 [Rhizophagus clarus]GES98099.1 hypothetical protein GLOIN_2v412706 [Rhizophagus clarus]
MDTNNSSPNNFNVYDSNLPYSTHTPVNHVTYNNNVNQQPISNNNAIFPDQAHQQFNVTSPNHNNQQQYQHTQQPSISNNTTLDNDHHNNHQQPISNTVSNNVSSDNNHQASNNISHHYNQQSTFNNMPPQFCHDQNQPNVPQSNILPLLNSFGININSPQATIIIMPTTNSDIQNQLQQALAYSTKTRFQQ